ncbi:telethonin [Danio rerio]|uniref:Telethonin n=1 Tax=Danio rerio TaxID=7955 RepID=E9QCX4_DANRE|nr:telethonin [Danio rerio]|eukprot:NP_001292500.1 telethonin [Danio rerio]
MQVCSVLEKKGGCVVGAELSCSVREENPNKRESYTADWRSINMKTQPEDRQSMLMSDDSRRESLSRYWQVRPLHQACPSGVRRVGTVDTGVREHQLLPYRNSLPLPIFKPAELGVRLGRGAPHTLEDLPPVRIPDGVCPDKRAVEQITRDLPPVKPMRMEFAKAPRALGRSMSQEAQRG